QQLKRPVPASQQRVENALHAMRHSPTVVDADRGHVPLSTSLHDSLKEKRTVQMMASRQPGHSTTWTNGDQGEPADGDRGEPADTLRTKSESPRMETKEPSAASPQLVHRKISLLESSICYSM